MSRFFSKKYSALKAYVPGEQPKDKKYIKLNTNESPYPPSASVLKAVSAEAGELMLYSDPEASALTKKCAEIYGVSPDMVLMTNGSDEILNFAFMAFSDSEHPIVFPEITYGFYPVFAELGDYKDSEEYLARFTVLPDMPLSVDYVSTDNLGNEGSTATSTYRYDRNGNLQYYFYRMNNDQLTTQLTLGYRHRDLHYVYDDQGNLSKLEFGYFYTDSSDLQAVVTFTWEGGKPVSSHTQLDTGGTYDTTYVFDEAGRISEITLDDSPYNTYVTTYTYDDNGNLTQKVTIRYYSSGSLADRHTWTYTLDDNGHPVRMTYLYEYSYDSGRDVFYHTQEDVHEYTCDSQGRILTDTVTYGQIHYSNGDVTNPVSVSTIYTYTYGDYYFFQ